MYKLFLDDERFPEHVTWINIGPGPWEVVRNYEEFVNSIAHWGVPRFITFDHDLADVYCGGIEKTGYHCACWLVEYCADNNIPFPQYTVHSMNPIGAEKIHSYIRSAIDIGFITQVNV